MATINGFVLHIDTMLTNLSVMYRNPSYVADTLFPVVPVQKQSDLYVTYGKDNLRQIDDSMAPLAKSNQIDANRGTTQYYCDGHGLSYPLSDEDKANDDLGTLEMDITTMLCDQTLLNREISLVNAITSGITTTIDLSADSGAQQFSNDSFDPIKFIDAQKLAVAQATGRKPNTMVLASPVLSGLRNNALVKARITGAPNLDGSAITLQQLANVLDLKQVLEASAVVNTAAQGQTDNLEFVWGNNALLAYVADAPAPRAVSLGYHFMWNFLAKSSYSNASAAPKPVGDLIPNGAGYGVRMWREEGRRAMMIEALLYYSQALVCPDAGVLLTNAVA